MHSAEVKHDDVPQHSLVHCLSVARERIANTSPVCRSYSSLFLERVLKGDKKDTTTRI